MYEKNYYFYYYYLFQLNKVEKKGDSFRTELASYFEELALFDKDLAEKDLAYSQDLYKGHVRDIKKVSDRIAENFATLFKMTLTAASFDLREKLYRLAVEFINACNPIKGLSQGFKVVTDIMDAMREVAHGTKVLARVVRAFERELPNVDKIAGEIKKSRKKNDEVLENMTKILNGTEPMTVERAKTFLEKYFEWNKYGEKEQIVRLGGIMESLVETTCDAVDGMSSVIGSTIAAVEAGICPFFLYTHFFVLLFIFIRNLGSGLTLQFLNMFPSKRAKNFLRVSLF